VTSVANSSAEPAGSRRGASETVVYWTAFIGLFFDYYDLYLFIYLERTLAAHFALGTAQSGWLQFTGLAGVGVGALVFGYLADRWGRGRMMLAVFGVYLLGIAGISLAWDYGSLLVFRLVASLALGAEWGISHTYLAERVGGVARYRFSAFLQFSILGGLLAALATRYGLPVLGWRGLFAASLVPIIVLSIWRWRSLREHDSGTVLPAPRGASLAAAMRLHGGRFALCLLLASLTIASGTVNVFYARELPQSVVYTIFFWGNVAPGMLLGAWLVRRAGVSRALAIYALGLLTLSLVCWTGIVPSPALTFALVLPLLNGIPFGLMGAYFNEVFQEYRTMFSGAAYNLGRIAAGFSPLIITALGLHVGGRYFLFSAAVGLGVGIVAWVLGRRRD
jgi:MFS transporter, AAHS family, cis,cis-muconate transporter